MSFQILDKTTYYVQIHSSREQKAMVFFPDLSIQCVHVSVEKKFPFIWFTSSTQNHVGLVHGLQQPT